MTDRVEATLVCPEHGVRVTVLANPGDRPGVWHNVPEPVEGQGRFLVTCSLCEAALERREA